MDSAAEASSSPVEHRETLSTERPNYSYPRFLWRAVGLATNGGWMFYGWMILLTAVALVGANAWAVQVRDGMIVTNMTDHVSWGLYIANFTFMVGLAAGGVMMVIPAYLYHDKDMHDTVIIGELLAIASIVMCLMFVIADLGRPDRFTHMLPLIGKFNFPISMLTWDVIVLNGYLLLNLHICGYLLYKRFLGETPDPRWYVPFVFISIVWAVSIHTVTAFLYCGLGGRPFWNTSLLAPKFLTSAFVSGPAFIIVVLQLIRRLTSMQVGEGSIRTLVAIMRVTILINLLMTASEIFTIFYTGGSHAQAGGYLYFGHGEQDALVPWIWTSIAMSVVAAGLLLRPKVYRHAKWLNAGCVLAFVGIWIEKGMGLIIPGFIPSTLHEIVEYVPSATEWKVTAGIWAAGMLVYTVLLKVAIPIFTGQVTIRKEGGKKSA
ncbi:sulfate reduction electron transfer complex DsrMKJOP subunit DsrP [Sulfuriroseicoccus oceanibius]|uniref:Polysulfide reductase NrfD n=1 Tax=Sulfuriroseicoccus oceanibius TaxID=2707525 RepID=A0A6B3L6P4_9BACT|nr:NrfD/PsrC family molybdoenzyme membrane anchor subunit [Sulfuriroseicoccus oceanibius]QQL44853.1 polysulfide reductase NrfD [Sulfuriroseicoccus oceanibius]